LSNINQLSPLFDMVVNPYNVTVICTRFTFTWIGCYAISQI